MGRTATATRTTYRPLVGPIRYLSRERHGSLSATAEAAGVDRSQLSRILNGHLPLSWEVGAALAVALACPVEAVMEPIRDEVAA